MRKSFAFLLVLMMVFSFSFSLKAKEKKKVHVFVVNHSPSLAAKKGDPAVEREKWERYLKKMQRKRQLHSRARLMSPMTSASVDNPHTVEISGNPESYNIRPDLWGNTVFLGTCTNTGSEPGVFVEVEATFFNEQNEEIGRRRTYVEGGDNVRLDLSGVFTNAIGPNDTGFFRHWGANIDYSQVYRVEIQFFDEIYSHAPANATVNFFVEPQFSADPQGRLEVSGSMINSSSNYMTYFTEVHFAVFDQQSRVQDVGFTWVQGSSYDYGTGTTDTALYPDEIGPYSHTFIEVDYLDVDIGNFLSSFEWNEVSTGGLEERDPPFGSFDTPPEGSTVSGSIACTGWALDDTGVDSVELYWQDDSGTGTRYYLGDAATVEGQRPDVAELYPEYPNNTGAGWGYMLLTNFLPNSGNGTYILYAIATDAVGNSTELGSRTIHCDNANAVNPFGAIDTPTQGGTASGSAFANHGWVLTPPPSNIPTEGSTINVWVNSVNQGHPSYNHQRSDVAALFPSYENSDGAGGLFSIDTTTYHDGVHTIFWTAQDNAGNADGIGSRYFSINNSGTNSVKQSPKVLVGLNAELSRIPMNNHEPVRVKKGFNRNIKPFRRYPDNNGIITFEIAELDRIEVRLFPEGTAGLGPMYTYIGFQIIGNQLTRLPIGSTLDAKKGIFHWIPAHGFLGPFHLVFVETRPDGTMTRKDILVEVVPRTSVIKGD